MKTRPGPCFVLMTLFAGAVFGAEPPAGVRLADAKAAEQARAFHAASQQRSGVLVPMYVYPADIHTNAAYNRLIDIKRRFETVPIWVILNPGSGPGTAVDVNYTKAIDRLQGAGCVTLGYISTRYGKATQAEVERDLLEWRLSYPKIQGVFFDEMIYENSDKAANHQERLTHVARTIGYWPVVGNPGADTPGIYFERAVADVIVVHEGDHWPAEERLKGDYFGGNSDYPPWTRSVLLHSQEKFDPAALDMARKYARWFYITERPYRANDPTAANPWDSLSLHLESLCGALANHP